jgi:CHAD domain-containing protein
VVTRVSGAAYRTQMEDLTQCLQAPPDNDAPHAELPIKALVQKKVLKQYRRICRKAAALQADTPDEAIHTLRIQCKKLRYLLELFAELFPEDPMRDLVRRLKRLQNHLGRFNDYAVQGGVLREQGQGVGLCAAQRISIDGLVAVLYNRQREERGRVQDTLAAFAKTAVRRHVQALCSTEAREGT